MSLSIIFMKKNYISHEFDTDIFGALIIVYVNHKNYYIAN